MIKDETLGQAIMSKTERVRAFALKELKRRDKLSHEDVVRLREDSSPEVREICFEFLIENKKTVDPNEVRNAFRQDSSHQRGIIGSLLTPRVNPEELLIRVYRGWPKVRLLELLDWYELDGHLAYRAIALDHFPEQGSRIRNDLKTHFQNFKKESDALQRKKQGDIAEAILQAYEEKKLNSFIRSQFTAAALAGLVKHGESSDALIGRDYLSDSHEEVILEAVRVIERFGDASDVSALIALAINKYGKLKELAATVALKLAPGPNGAAGPLLASEDATLVDIVIKSMKDDPIDEIAKFFDPLLSSNNDNVRLKVLVFFARNFPPNKLKDLLTGYMNGSSYYYNVVCWLDRILYAPKFLRDIFAHELERKLG